MPKRSFSDSNARSKAAATARSPCARDEQYSPQTPSICVWTQDSSQRRLTARSLSREMNPTQIHGQTMAVSVAWFHTNQIFAFGMFRETVCETVCCLQQGKLFFLANFFLFFGATLWKSNTEKTKHRQMQNKKVSYDHAKKTTHLRAYLLRAHSWTKSRTHASCGVAFHFFSCLI